MSKASEVYYDGACPICSREIATYRGLDGMDAVAWTDVSLEVPPGLDREALLARFHVRLENGEMVSGARAFLALWRRNPKLRVIAVVLDRRPFVSILELGYRGFLRIRRLWR